MILQPMVSKMEGLLFLILQETIFVIDIVLMRLYAKCFIAFNAFGSE